MLFNPYIPCSATIGSGTKVAYGGIGCVIHSRDVIGNDCVIGTNVTIGGKSKKYNVPIIGDNVYLSNGSKILGDIKSDNGTIIGANAVVVKDVPGNFIVAGTPAKVVKENISISDYYLV